MKLHLKRINVALTYWFKGWPWSDSWQTAGTYCKAISNFRK